MSKKKIMIRLAIVLFIVIGILFAGLKILNSLAGKVMSKEIQGIRATLYGDVPKNKRQLVAYGERIEHEIRYGARAGERTVQDYLDTGCDPNYCLNLTEGWQYTNPLMLFNTAAIYVTYVEENPSYPDIKVFNQLMAAGANINKYPYVWAAVFCRGNWLIDMTRQSFQEGEITETDMKNEIASDIKDTNRVLKLFLDAGADVNRKGSPVPFEKNICEKISEAKIQKYFNSPDSTSPIYEAIKKGMVWESQVDLLLEYGAILDESCLAAAKLSGDEAMIKKVKTLLELQGK